MNLQQFLEEEQKELQNFIDTHNIKTEIMDIFLKHHDTRLINNVLDEVKNSLEKELEKWDESAEELEDGWGNYTVCLPWELKEKKLEISTIIDQLKLK